MNYLISSLYIAAIITAGVITARSYRNRFLPMAVPIATLSIVMMCVCFIQFNLNYGFDIFNNHHLVKIMVVIGISASFFIMPLWFWTMGEYKDGQKYSITRYWWLFIEPFVSLSILLTNKVELNELSNQGLAKQIHFLGDYALIHRAYMFIVAIILLIWSINVIRQKTKNSLVSLLQFAGCIITPMLLFLAYRDGYIDKPIGASALVLILVWAAKQSYLLDIIPSALSGVMNRVQAGIIVFNNKTELVYYNEFASSLFKLPRQKKYRNSTLIKDSPAALLLNFFDFDSPTSQAVQFELNLSGDGIKKRHIDASYETISNSTTMSNLGCVILLQDISLQKKSEMALAQHNEKLTELNRQKSDFFAGISHEFRTPLTLILGALDEFSSNEHPALSVGQKKTLHLIRNNNQRLLDLVKQLLELSQINSGHMTLKPQKIELSEYLPQVLANFEIAARKQKTIINIQNNSLCSKVFIDLNSLNKIITNLLSNSLKSIQHEGAITLSLDDHDDGFLQLSVQDNGHGIAPSALPYIFDAFYSLDNAHPNWPAGSGIGLHLVQQLLEKHGAHISVKSNDGMGSRFIILFNRATHPNIKHAENTKPLKTDIFNQTSPTVNQAGEQLPAPPPASSETKFELNSNSEKLILVVEDNVDMRRFIRRQLAEDFRLIEAKDGDEGFELAQHSVPDLILTDLMMPKVNGLQLSERLRNAYATSHIPIIVLTAKALKQDRIESFNAGVDEFITKPFDAEFLNRRIHNLINSRLQLQKSYQSDSVKRIESPRNIENLFIENLHTFVRKNISHSNLLISDLASHVHMSERSLNRKLNAIEGLSPNQWLLRSKLTIAREKLRYSTDSVTKIALETGFTDSSHFSKSFKKIHSISPIQYRKSVN